RLGVRGVTRPDDRRMRDERYEEHEHPPPHLFRAGATYFVTASTLYREPIMEPLVRRQQCSDSWHHATAARGWRLVAWAFLPNHYHLLTVAPPADAEIAPLVGSIHQYTARRWNREDRAAGRRVWWNFWDTCISYEGSFYARLNYIHWNPVRHGLVTAPEEYPFSSYRLFLADSELLLRHWEA